MAVMHLIRWLPTAVINQKEEDFFFFQTEWYILSAKVFPICAAEHSMAGGKHSQLASARRSSWSDRQLSEVEPAEEAPGPSG